MKKTLKISGIILGCLFLFFWYLFSYTETVYGFKDRESKFEQGTVLVRLNPDSYSTYPNLLGLTQERRSPYEVFVSVRFEDKPVKGTVRVSKIKFTNNLTKKIAYESAEVVEGVIKKYGTQDKVKPYSYKAFFLFDKRIDLEFEDMLLEIEFSLIQDGKVTEYRTEVLLEKYYDSYRASIGV